MTGSTRGLVPVSVKLICASEEFQFNFNSKETFGFSKCIHLSLTHPDVAKHYANAKALNAEVEPAAKLLFTQVL